MITFRDGFARIEAHCKSRKYLSDIEQLKQTMGDRRVVLYGAGVLGLSVARSLARRGIDITCFCDANKTGIHTETNLPIVSPDLLNSEYADANVIICSVNFFNEIHRNLQRLGVAPGRIFSRENLRIHEMTWEDIQQYLEGYEWAYSFFSDDISKRIILERIEGYLFSTPLAASSLNKQYFEPDIVRLDNDEVFVDGGMFTGDTAQVFINSVGGSFKHYYGFEPDRSNYEIAMGHLAGVQNITLLQKGLWSRETTLRFSDSLSSSSALSDSGAHSVHVTSLDSFFASSEHNPTFIKMDVEGAEKEALRGAEAIIRTHKPKLAICVYHKPEDIYELAQLVSEFHSEYTFSLRHYTNSLYETVMYAV